MGVGDGGKTFYAKIDRYTVLCKNFCRKFE